MSKKSIIIEIGGGANPALSKKQVLLGNFEYILVDISQEELNKSNGDYFTRVCSDITKDKLGVKADLIITQMLLEHVSNPVEFHTSCFELLKPHGKAIHFYATLFSLASITNSLLPEKYSKQLLYKIQKRKWEYEGKFPAYYRWSLGPVKKQILRFEKIGFKILRFNGYLGQNYFINNKWLRPLEKVYNKFLLLINSSWFCSNSILIICKENRSI